MILERALLGELKSISAGESVLLVEQWWVSNANAVQVESRPQGAALAEEAIPNVPTEGAVQTTRPHKPTPGRG